ncbi:MAG TPA: response regulator transcription factor [Acidimicrobiales bacterium]|nr:response regulator transcription factor [Acidimicrobiales bacterium]
MRALVVEDEARLAELLRRGLGREGYDVDVAPDGRSGLEQALRGGYDAVVLDAMLPGVDGFEFCRRLRDEECWTPVLMLTARDSVTDRIRGLDSGADDYLTKPFEFGELTARLRALVRRGGMARALPLEVGDLKLDPAALTVSRGGVHIELTAKELALLELLMRHAGDVLSRSRILDEVWDFASYPNSNVVDQYVGYLRRKVDKPFGRSDIETVRGVGYRLRGGG